MKRFENPAALEQVFRGQGYIADPALLTSLYLLGRLGRPLLLEGNAGVGKTDTAKVLAAVLKTELIRLQCYEGLDVNSAVYEWNYQKQLLAIRLGDGAGETPEQREGHIFSRDFLLERPLLRAITVEERAPVLLIDEVDRADEEFEAFLLELLADFQITIPEIGTIQARHRPYVILTSNRTRELSDALKRRCLYHWIDYPGPEKELEIVRAKVPEAGEKLAREVVAAVQTMRGLRLSKPPGVAETLDWVLAMLALERPRVDQEALEATMGCFLKSTEDCQLLRENFDQVLAAIPGG